MSPWLKFHLMQSLVLSRLLYCAHLVVPTAAWMRKLQAVQVRVLRRIAGETAHCHTVHSDRQIRELLGQPSVDCMLMRARLAYLKRLVVNSPPKLCALLFARPVGKRLPWVELVAADMRWLRRSVAHAEIAGLPCPDEAPMAWLEAVRGPRWADCVSRAFFTSSIVDPRVAVADGEAGPVPAFKCPTCERAFPSDRQLAGHRQRAHGWRREENAFIDDSACCPVCMKRFADRMAVLDHVRKGTCGAALLAAGAEYRRVPSERLEQLEDRDRRLRLQARHDGRTVPYRGEVLS